MEKVSCCLITKDPVYPSEVLEHVSKFPFSEILILTHSDSPFRKYELFKKAKYDMLFYEDDDAICPIEELSHHIDPEKIVLAMKEGHFEAYKDKKYTMGMGWGAFFHRKMLDYLKKYTDVFGEDVIFQRETERILTYFAPHKRLILPIQDLPSAYAEDRLWRQPHHHEYAELAERRCAAIA